jgi:glycosyltransferase involved in cell wall biosynthesis
MRILLLTDNFVPETNSPARRAYEHARDWVSAGHQVTVVTSIPNFPTGRPLPPYKNKPRQREQMNGIDVVRVWTVLAPNNGVILRSLDFLSFALSGFLAGLFERADVIVASSPQLLTGMAGSWLGRIKARPWLIEVRDLWPDSIVAVGAMRENFYIRGLRRLERHLYKHASRIVAVSDGIRDRIIACGISPDKIGVVPNGVELDRLGPRAKDPSLVNQLELNGKFVVGYVGTHGLAQGLEAVLQAAQLMGAAQASFIFVGEGARREYLMNMAGDLKLDNVRFVGLVSAERAADHLALCDIVLIPLRRSSQLEITIPSKIFEAAAMERPMIVGAEGASARLVEHYGAGLVVPPEDPQALAAAIARLQSDEALLAGLRDGCRRLAKDFDRRKFAAAMLEQICLVTSSRVPVTCSG